MGVLHLCMLATYNTFLHTNRFLRELVEEHRSTKNALKIIAVPEEDFLTVMRNRRAQLIQRHSILSERMQKSINETKSILGK